VNSCAIAWDGASSLEPASTGLRPSTGRRVVAMHLDPEILLLDEVLAVGDEGFKERSMATMPELLGRSGSIVFVSHAVRQLAEFCER